MTVTVKKVGRTWAVVDAASGQIIEGGFFSRDAAERAAEAWRADR